MRQVFILLVLSQFIFACSLSNNNSGDGAGDNTNNVQPSTVDGSGIVSNPDSSSPVQTVDDDTTTGSGSVTPPENTQTGELLTSEGLATSPDALATLLITQYELQDNQVVPTSGWVCVDSVEQYRVYYFFESGLLDGSRRVAIERTLNVNDSYTDISFFWSAVDTDAITMTSATRGRDGQLISSGRQYDVNSIRFLDVDGVRTFSANSVLRGDMVCADYALL